MSLFWSVVFLILVVYFVVRSEWRRKKDVKRAIEGYASHRKAEGEGEKRD